MLRLAHWKTVGWHNGKHSTFQCSCELNLACPFVVERCVIFELKYVLYICMNKQLYKWTVSSHVFAVSCLSTPLLKPNQLTESSYKYCNSCYGACMMALWVKNRNSVHNCCTVPSFLEIKIWRSVRPNAPSLRRNGHHFACEISNFIFLYQWNLWYSNFTEICSQEPNSWNSSFGSPSGWQDTVECRYNAVQYNLMF